MLVSVIVPVYNTAFSINGCLDSIISQTYSNIEIVIVDDGSTDDSGLICDQYANKDSRIEVIHTKNQGVSSARNLGINKAQGEYVSFIDSDDTIPPDYIEKLVNPIKKEKAYDLVICNFKLIFTNKTIDMSYTNQTIFNGEFIHDYQFLRSIISFPWGKLYKLKLINDYQIRFPVEFPDAEDQMFNFEYYKYIKDYCLINEPLYHYTQRQDSISKKASLRSFECNLIKLRYELDFYKFMHIQNYPELIANSCLRLARKYVVLENLDDNFKNYQIRIKKAKNVIKDELKMVKVSNISKKNIAIMFLKYDMYFFLWLYYKIRKYI